MKCARLVKKYACQFFTLQHKSRPLVCTSARAQSPEKLQARLRDTAGAVERERLRLADAERRSRDLQTRLDAVAKARTLLRPPQEPCEERPVGSAALGLASPAWSLSPRLTRGGSRQHDWQRPERWQAMAQAPCDAGACAQVGGGSTCHGMQDRVGRIP
jgi:hypothetical protein